MQRAETKKCPNKSSFGNITGTRASAATTTTAVVVAAMAPGFELKELVSVSWEQKQSSQAHLSNVTRTASATSASVVVVASPVVVAAVTPGLELMDDTRNE